MDRPALLVLVRHGESMRNVAKDGNVYFRDEAARQTVLGIPDQDIPLTELGKLQARLTGIGLRRDFGAFDYHYTSGYLRTNQTDEGIREAYPEYEIDDGNSEDDYDGDRKVVRVRRNLFIRERDPGYTYEMTEAEANAAYPDLQKYWREFGGFFARPPGGESLAQVVERVYMFYNALVRDRPGKKILVNTHGGTIRCFRFLLERWDYNRAIRWPKGQAPANCGVVVYRYSQEKKRLVLVDYNRVYYDQAQLTHELEHDITRS